jgi:nuclear cap-binding protein subunit 1
VIQILRNAVNKTCNRLADLRKDIATLEKAVHAAEELSFKAVKDYEEAKLICEATDGKEQGQPSARVKRLEAYAERARKDEVTAHESLEAKLIALSGAMDESKVHIVSTFTCCPVLECWEMEFLYKQILLLGAWRIFA